MERLQKVIAQSGFCSRRKAEAYILEGKVTVNGKTVDILGTKVKSSDSIRVDGKLLAKEEKVYYVINKPKGCVSTSKDQFGRKTVLDYITTKERVYPVGRLDYDTSGVLFLSNDGIFTNHMIHPRYHLPKTYIVNLQGILKDQDIRSLRKGLKTKDARYLPAKVRILEIDPERERTHFELTIYEGKNHQVKKMMEALGYQVRKLHRSAIAFVRVDDLKPGEYRKLKPFEVKKLMAMCTQEDAQ